MAIRLSALVRDVAQWVPTDAKVQLRIYCGTNITLFERCTSDGYLIPPIFEAITHDESVPFAGRRLLTIKFSIVTPANAQVQSLEEYEAIKPKLHEEELRRFKRIQPSHARAGVAEDSKMMAIWSLTPLSLDQDLKYAYHGCSVEMILLCCSCGWEKEPNDNKAECQCS